MTVCRGGQIALRTSGIPVKRYVAYEIDKYAIQTTLHNFPETEECGDVMTADFTKYEGFDLLCGGSPCVPAGSKVKTNRGYKNIEDIEIGDMVLTHKNRYLPVSRLYERQSSHIYHVKFNGGDILDITGNHPVYTYRNNEFVFIRTDELTLDDYVCVNIDQQQNQLERSGDIPWLLETTNPNTKIIGDKLLIKIESISKETTNIKVYNIETVEDHSYTVNNVIVHNCTYWSIAQSPDKRETTASGIGWELFSHYVRALHEARPKYFIYENNKSMSNAIRQSVSEAFGFEPILINSALVSAQNRQRLYWVGKRNDDGTYSKVDISQPEDRGVILRDILDSGTDLTSRNKSYTLTATYDGACPQNTIERSQRNMVAEPVNTTKKGKSQTIKSQYQNTNEQNICCYKSTYGATGVAIPVKYPLESVTDNETGVIGKLEMPKGNHDLVKRVYSPNGKSPTLNSCGGGNREPKTFSETNTPFSGKNIYEVKDGQITIKNKQYPIKLKDGYYIIRKLTVDECKRLQTVPDWFEFKWRKTEIQDFGDEVLLCKSAKLKDAISQLQAKKLAYATNIICGSSETELRNLVENMLTTIRLVKKKGVTENVEHYKVTASNIIKNGNVNNQSMKQKNALRVVSQSGIMDATGCVLNITLNGSEQETLCIEKKDNLNLMEMMDVNTTKHLTEDGFIELLQKKFLEENSPKAKLFIISILTNWIIVRTIYMFATTKPISVCIDSLNDWQPHCLKMELLSLKMENIGGMSNSSAYKMLGNGWTIEVIVHLIKSLKIFP